MSAKARIGVVGAGSLGFHHIRLLREVADVELVGFHERRAERAAQVAAELGVRAWDSLDAMLEAVDAITVVVPTAAHHPVARAALERGRHVLVEKPITGTLEEADDLLAVAARSGALLQIGHVERFNRAVRAADPYLDHPLFIESDRLAPFNARGADVAVVLDLMIHDIDLVRSLVGAHVAELSAVGIPVLTGSVDIANARLTFDGGTVANITASRVSRERMRKIRIFQRSGYLSLDLAAGSGEFYRLRPGVELGAVLPGAGGTGAPGGPLPLEAFVERISLEANGAEPLQLELASFAGAVLGRHPVAVSGEDGREALALALRIVAEIERAQARLTGRNGG
ncbi:MAG TPA: Gfo/Idh/MocA family oxidoreductase [Gemmatimonadaceae bacterium]|nr:Gfo/Idh/MocA family oxidoreductase [Gemmatimonadaceae bacterium]